MPKMKTKKSASKRFSLTGTGKIKYKKMNLRHILTKRSPKRKMHEFFQKIQQQESANSSFHTADFRSKRCLER